MDRIAVLVIGYGHEKLPNVSDGTGAGQTLHALLSFRNPTCRTNESVITRHISIEHRDLFT